MPGAIGDAKGVNLNNASEEELENIGGLGGERAPRIVQSRPFKSWDDLKRVEGFSDTLVEDCAARGRRSPDRREYSLHHHPAMATKKHAGAAARGRRGGTVARQRGAGIMQAVRPDEAVAPIVGSRAMPRPLLMKRIWSYIKSHHGSECPPCVRPAAHLPMT